MAEIYREDKYRININGKSVAATPQQESKLRAMNDDQIENFLELMGKKENPNYGVAYRESRYTLNLEGKSIRATPEQEERIRRLDAESTRKFMEIMTGEKYVQR